MSVGCVTVKRAADADVRGDDRGDVHSGRQSVVSMRAKAAKKEKSQKKKTKPQLALHVSYI